MWFIFPANSPRSQQDLGVTPAPFLAVPVPSTGWDTGTVSPGQPTLGAPATPIRKVWKLGIGVREGAAFRRICVKGNPARGSLPATHRPGLRGEEAGGEGEGTGLLPITPGAVGSPHPWQCHPTPHRNGCTLTPSKPLLPPKHHSQKITAPRKASFPANHHSQQVIAACKLSFPKSHCSQENLIPSKPSFPKNHCHQQTISPKKPLLPGKPSFPINNCSQQTTALRKTISPNKPLLPGKSSFPGKPSFPGKLSFPGKPSFPANHCSQQPPSALLPALPMQSRVNPKEQSRALATSHPLPCSISQFSRGFHKYKANTKPLMDTESKSKIPLGAGSWCLQEGEL